LGKERGKYKSVAACDRNTVIFGQAAKNYINEGEKLMNRILDEEQSKLPLDESTRLALKEINRKASAKAADNFRDGVRKAVMDCKVTDAFP
jgi:hypothetical protein